MIQLNRKVKKLVKKNKLTLVKISQPTGIYREGDSKERPNPRIDRQ